MLLEGSMDNMKHCSGCDRDLSLESFAWKNKAKRIYQRWCKQCQRKANKVHYQNNMQIYKDRAIERNNRVIAENRQKLYDYFSLTYYNVIICSFSKMAEHKGAENGKRRDHERRVSDATAREEC
jgi:hypothetical protein